MRRHLELKAGYSSLASQILFYIDLKEDHSNTALDAVTEVCKLIQQSPDHALVVRRLVPHANQPFDRVLKPHRKLEDIFLRQSVSFAGEGSLHNGMDGLDGMHARLLESRFFVVVAIRYASESLWNAMPLARGDAGLVAVCDQLGSAGGKGYQGGGNVNVNVVVEICGGRKQYSRGRGQSRPATQPRGPPSRVPARIYSTLGQQGVAPRGARTR